MANAQAVETGLNNLVHFSAAIWLTGLDYDTRAPQAATHTSIAPIHKS